MRKPRILKTGKDLRAYKKQHCNKLCPICRRVMANEQPRNITIDHDHKTGRVRGVLCRNCNWVEGFIAYYCQRAGNHIQDDKFLLNIIKYWAKSKKYPKNVYYPGTKIINGEIVPKKIKRRKRKSPAANKAFKG